MFTAILTGRKLNDLLRLIDMKLSKLRIENFRSFKDETIYFDDYTCLVGANGTGKSAVLTALNVFFRNNASTATNVLTLSKEDFHHKSTRRFSS
jgi:predicted ATP-dependent endonuclease of OLD family